jgi:hypothetical protein
VVSGKHIGFHFVSGAYREAVDLGATFTWINPDVIGGPDWLEWEASGLDGVLQIYVNQDRLFDTGGCWRRDVTNTVNALRQRGLLSRLLAIQLHDELHTRVTHQPNILTDDQWPALVHVPPAHRLMLLNVLLGARALELRAIFGADLPPHGVGIAEAGGVANVLFPGLDWLGLNVYLGPGYYPDAASMARVYDAAVKGPHPLMPVIGCFADGASQPPSLFDMGAAYGPIFSQHAAKFWAVAFFCLRHPSAYSADHLPGRGLLQLDPSYREAVRMFIRQYKAGA